MYKEDLTLNNQQWLIRPKTQPNQTLDMSSMIISVLSNFPLTSQQQ